MCLDAVLERFLEFSNFLDVKFHLHKSYCLKLNCFDVVIPRLQIMVLMIVYFSKSY